MKQPQIQSLAKQAILDCLSTIPFLRLKTLQKHDGPDYCPDMIVEALGKDHKKYTLLAEITNNGQPRIIRDAVARLTMCKNKYSNPYGIVIAPYISELSVAICKNAGLGYIDLKGNYHVAFDSVYIERAGMPNDSEKRDLKYIYSPKAERVLRVLLGDVSKSWKIKKLSEEAGVSIGHVFNVKNRLEQRELLEDGKVGFKVAKPKELLEDWAKNYSAHKNEIYRFWSPSKAAELEVALFAYAAKEKFRCALTSFSAAAVYAPMVIQPRLFAYGAGDIKKLVSVLNLKPVESGENVQLIIPYDDGVFIDTRKMRNRILVSPIQAYLDLVAMGGRGEEAAKSIMEQVLKW